jgi:UDP-2,4-diacetamido-2,4,6-trideoxy-beta-L-altropyranose hydrolase
MRVAFRAEASTRIGSGHVMRCLTLARALRETGADIRFLCRAHAGHLGDTIKATDLPVTLLATPPDSGEPIADADYPAWLGVPAETDAAETIAALDGWRPDWLVVDHYGLDQTWERALRPHVGSILVIDDLANRPHDCDLLLDQNYHLNAGARYFDLAPPGCGCLLGPDHALLSPDYAELHPRAPPRGSNVERILVFFGMADGANLTGRTVAAFLALERRDITLDVVIHPANPHAAALRDKAKAHPNIVLHDPQPSLAPLMMKADLAIGAGGATSWERCCLGLPSLVITLAENQKTIAAELGRYGCLRWLGHHDEVSQDDLTKALRQALAPSAGTDMSKRCLELVDGRGTNRVAGFMMLHRDTRLRARHAGVADEALLLRWANDPVTRRNAINTASIDARGHREWFHRRLRSLEECRIFVVETEQGVPIGQVRFDLSDGQWSIDYALDPCARGRRLGVPLLRTALCAFRQAVTGAIVFGHVKSDNAASRQVFESLGFASDTAEGGGQLYIAVASDAGSWLNDFIPALVLPWLTAGHRCAWAHKADNLPAGDICFYLGYARIVGPETRDRHRHNLVVHESALPHGRGWSPMTWQVLEGASRIPVTLLEAVDEVDSGAVLWQTWMALDGNELVHDLRDKQFEATRVLCHAFVESYPDSAAWGVPQQGNPTWYARRRREDSALAPDQPLADQFDLLRVVDNDRYPAFVRIRDELFRVQMKRMDAHE